MTTKYDFSNGVRGKYAKAFKENGYVIRVYRQDGTFTEKRVLGEKAVTLEPDVQAYFPDSKSVNRALGTLISLIPNKRKPAAPKGSAESGKGSKRRLKA